MSRTPLTYGVPVATVRRMARQARFFQRLLVILGTNSHTVAKELGVSKKTATDWRELREPIPTAVYNVLLNAYFDYTDAPSKTWATFSSALKRRARAARLPGFDQPNV
jgi:hypothetical protein